MGDQKPPLLRSGAEGDFDVFAFISKLKQEKFTAAAVMAISILAGVAYLHLANYRYTTSLVVIPTPREQRELDGGLSGLASVAGISLPSVQQTNFSLYLEGLHSRAIADFLAEDEQLLRTIYQREWDEQARAWAEPAGLFQGIKGVLRGVLGFPPSRWAPPSGARLHEFINEEVTIAQDEESQISTLTIKTESPIVGREFLRKLHKSVDEYIRQKSIRSAKSYVSYILGRLEEVRVEEYREALVSALAQQEKSLMLASDEAAFAAEAFGEPYSSLKPTDPKPVVVLLLSLIAGAVVSFGAIIWKSGHRARSG